MTRDDDTPPTDEPPTAMRLDEAIDAERARLIGRIYDVVLHPESFDSFMGDWSVYVDQALRRLGDIRVTEGEARQTLDDPVIETHFRRALALFERLGRGDVDSAVTGDAENVLIRLGRGGAVLDRGPDATALFGAAPELGAIQASLEPDSAARFARFLAAFERAPASGRFAVLSLSDPGRAEGHPGSGLVAAVTCRDASGEGFVVELRPLVIRWTPVLDEILTQSFRLTPRETELLRALSAGDDLAGIAAGTGRSVNTLRAQLKSVFAKTRTGTQAELMRLVSVLLLHGPEGQVKAAPPAVDGREIRVTTEDGRQVPVHLFGPRDGLPVVFLHGMLEGLGVTTRLETALRTHGIRLIAPVRVNYGQAEADTRIREAPDLAARDVGAVLEHLGIDAAILLGHMAGMVHAYAGAARLGRRVPGLVAVSGCVPVRSVEQFARMTPRQRAVAYTARFAPALLPAILRAGIAQIDSAAASGFMTSLYPEDSPDRALIGHPDIGAAIIDGYRFTVAQGLQAFRTDAWHITRDWSALMRASDCPVLMIHGTRDTVITIDSVRAQAQSSNRFTLIEDPARGQLLFYDTPDTVLRQVARFARDRLSAPS